MNLIGEGEASQIEVKACSEQLSHIIARDGAGPIDFGRIRCEALDKWRKNRAAVRNDEGDILKPLDCFGQNKVGYRASCLKEELQHGTWILWQWNCVFCLPFLVRRRRFIAAQVACRGVNHDNGLSLV